MRFAFRFRWVPFLAALAVALAGIALGEWQRGRALTKEHIASAMLERSALPPLEFPGSAQTQPVDSLEFRKVVARGEFLPNWLMYLDNRPHDGRAGLVLVAPLRMADGNVVLVMRGWLARDAQDRTRVPEAIIPSGQILVSGSLRRTAGHLLQLGSRTPLAPGAIVQNLEPRDFAAASGLQVLPFIIEESAPPTGAPDRLVRDWPLPASGADKHRGYAFQWYALALTALIFFLVTGFRNGSARNSGQGK